MLAINISCAISSAFENRSRSRRFCTGALYSRSLAALGVSLGVLAGEAQSPPSQEQAREIFLNARLEFESSSTNATAAWVLGRAAFDLAEYLTGSPELGDVIDTGLKACREGIRLDAGSAPAHYYLGLNLGQLARTKKLGALKLLREMEQAFLTARKLDPDFDFAGPDRSVGLLYFHAPGWPLSIGNRGKARTHLEAAARLHPEYPENGIALAEGYAKWAETEHLEKLLLQLDGLLPKSRQQFREPQWADAWRDWEKRLDTLEKLKDRLTDRPRISPSERGARKQR